MVALLLCGLPKLFAADLSIPLSQIKNTSPAMHIVSVGVDEYQDEFWPELKWATSDSRKIAQNMGANSGLKIVRHVMQNSDATLKNFRSTLLEIETKVGPDDTVIIYFSGHGTLAPSDNGELEPVVVLNDTKKDALLSTGLTHSELHKWLNRIQVRKTLTIFANCNSGEGKSRLPEYIRSLLLTKKGRFVSLPDVSEGTLILAAAARGEAAHEDDKLKGDIYTHYFIEALTVYDRNEDGVVSALEAHDYARDRTWNYTSGKQRPTANARFIGDADVALRGKKKSSGLPVLQAYDKNLAGLHLSVGLSPKGRLPSAFPLDPNGSIVSVYQQENNSPLARYKVTASEGETITLEEVVHHRPFSVSVLTQAQYWKDDRWENLTGEGRDVEMLLRAGFNWRDLGVYAYLPTKLDYSNKVRNALRAETEIASWKLALDYKYWMSRSFIELSGNIIQEEVEIDFVDEISGDRASFDDDSLSYGIGIGFNYRLWRDLFIGGRAGITKAEWQFETIGTLNGDRSWIELGAEYRFGGKARTL